MSAVHHRYATVDGHQIFYREAGRADAPTIVLLHGFPTSSYMFRNLVPALADNYRVIAPDHLGYGLSDAPSVDEFDYTFDALTDLPRGARALFDRAPDRDLFCTTTWFETVLPTAPVPSMVKAIV